jgi:hypothetical protein
VAPRAGAPDVQVFPDRFFPPAVPRLVEVSSRAFMKRFISSFSSFVPDFCTFAWIRLETVRIRSLRSSESALRSEENSSLVVSCLNSSPASELVL